MRMIRGFFCALFLAGMLSAAAVPVGATSDGAAGYRGAGRWEGISAAPVDTDDSGDGGLQKLELYAASAVLLDADSGRVLYAKEADTPMAMASTTKIMTCILVLERCELDDMAEVSAYAASMPKVKLSVKRGERYRIRDLLYSLMLESHNDSAVVLAEYVGKQLLPEELRLKDTADYTEEESRRAVKAFATLMNEKARELGCEQTWFITPNGLDATETFVQNNGEELKKEHSTTATELARIMAYCVGQSPQKELFREITKTADHSFSENGRSYSCSNHNAFLYMMEGAFSGKTGFTNKAGYCYVGALEREGRTFVVALLACGWPNNRNYKWSDTKKLMQYGVEHYRYRGFLEEGTAYDEGSLGTLSVVNGQTDILGGTARVKVKIAGRDGAQGGGTLGATGGSLAEGMSEERRPAEELPAEETCAERMVPGLLLREDEKIQTECRLQKSLTAPVRAGSVVGEILYSVDGQVYFKEDIVTAEGVEAIDLSWCVRQIWRRFSPFSCRFDR